MSKNGKCWDKVGPDGQAIYINNKSKYYWIDRKGHKHFVRKAELKEKGENSWLVDGMRYI